MELSKQATAFKLNQLDSITFSKPLVLSGPLGLNGPVAVLGKLTLSGGAAGLPEYADNAAAAADGLAVGDLYTTTGTVKVVTE